MMSQGHQLELLTKNVIETILSGNCANYYFTHIIARV